MTDPLLLLACLARPRRKEIPEHVLPLIAPWQPDLRVARALTVALVTDVSQGPPLAAAGADGEEGWLDVLTSLPLAGRFESGASTASEVVRHAGELRVCVTAHGVTAVPPPGSRTFVGETRAGLVDALLLALIQRDTIVGFARALAEDDRWNRRRL